MRASFQGQNVIALGNGIAKLQMPPLVVEPRDDHHKPRKHPDKSKTQPKLSHR